MRLGHPNSCRKREKRVKIKIITINSHNTSNTASQHVSRERESVRKFALYSVDFSLLTSKTRLNFPFIFTISLSLGVYLIERFSECSRLNGIMVCVVFLLHKIHKVVLCCFVLSLFCFCTQTHGLCVLHLYLSR